MKRHDGRRVDELRSLTITYGIYEYALGSVLFEIGKTKILCAVTLQPSVPLFLRGQSTGWLTAEYALLPAATVVRTNREISQMKRQGRSVEISRLISRSLRTITDLTCLADKTIMIDCDVLQADGGTRTASIIAAYAALCMAQNRLLYDGIIEKGFLKETIAAVSVGILSNGEVVLDPDYQEDSEGIADINIVMTYNNRFIELQGGAEKHPIDITLLSTVSALAQKGVMQIKQFVEQNKPPSNIISISQNKKLPLFSIQNRKPLQTHM